jgi:hypothetical protein
MVYVGVNLHRKRSHLVALDLTGEVVLSRRIGNAPAEFLRIFGELEPQPIEVVFEATYGWSWFADLLAGAGRLRPARTPEPWSAPQASAGPVRCRRWPGDSANTRAPARLPTPLRQEDYSEGIRIQRIG